MTVKGEWIVVWKDDDVQYRGNAFREIGIEEFNYFLPRFEVRGSTSPSSSCCVLRLYLHYYFIIQNRLLLST